MEGLEVHPYTSYVRGVEVDFSHANIRRVLRFREFTPGAETDYDTRQKRNQKLDEVLRDHYMPGSTWKMDVRAEELIADNIVIIAQRVEGKGKLGFPSTIYKLCKEEGVQMREFRRTEQILEGRNITTKVMETTRIPKIIHQNQHEEEEEDQPTPQYEAEKENADEQEQYQEQEQEQEQPNMCNTPTFDMS
ncbi:hypothetical protein PIB30_041031 [Stylosanthes scabra]|uniref:Uncharacterized protein n=1 Tax=Stylosanthes scabra TaxID=79078 RepID=A0ABU6RF13_9FABA|nr:hypothetical protein [Stylosanthes scabra]